MNIPKKIEKKLKKKKKTTFWHYFNSNRDEIYREREEKILIPNSIQTRPGQENSKKKQKNKFKKLKKPLSGIIYIQTGMG